MERQIGFLLAIAVGVGISSSSHAGIDDVPPSFRQSVQCMMEVLRKTPLVDQVEVGVLKSAGWLPPFVKYRYREPDGRFVSVQFVLQNSKQYFLGVLNGLSTPGVLPPDFGTEEITRQWQQQCRVVSIASAPFAHSGGEWFQVKGGAWEPDAATLSIAESKLRSAMGFGHNKASAIQWHRYLYQYQGTLAPQGRRTIHLEALCADLRELAAKELGTTYDLTAKWVPTNMGGGSCFVSANYDVAHGSVTDLKVAAPE